MIYWYRTQDIASCKTLSKGREIFSAMPYTCCIGIENHYNSNVFFYKLVSDFIPSSVQNGWFVYNLLVALMSQECF